MAISRVTGAIDTCGVCTSADAWTHTGNVTFLERAATLGNVGWLDNTEYLFEITFTSSLIEVFVDGVQQFSLTGSFEDGSFGFYGFSQENVLYAGITEEVVLPEPGSLGILGLGIVGLGVAARRRKG